MRLAFVDTILNIAPPNAELHSVILVEFKLMFEEDEPFRYNAPPFEFAVQSVMSVSFKLSVDAEPFRYNAPPESDVHFVMFVESKLSVDDEPFR